MRLARWVSGCLLGLAAAASSAQTLAHKGWAGNGLTVDPWWKNAVFYQLDPLSFQDSNGDGYGDLNGITRRLDYLQSLGVDAVVLSPFQLQPASTGKSVFEPVYGSEDDFDRLEQEAIRRHIRLVVDVPIESDPSPGAILAAARFWLTRGVAGLRVTAPAGEDAAEVRQMMTQLRRLCAEFGGDRVLISEVDQGLKADTTSDPVVQHGRAVPKRRAVPLPRSAGLTAQLTVDHRNSAVGALNVFAVQAMVFGKAPGVPTGLLVTDSANAARSWDRAGAADQLAMAKVVAAALMLGPEEPLLYFGQELGMAGDGPEPMQWGEPGFTTGTPWVAMGPNAATANVAAEESDAASLLSWYRTLSKLRHEEASLHEGSTSLIDTGYPAVVAWVRRGMHAKDQPVLVVCNVSTRPLVLSLTEPLRRLGLAASSGLHPLAMAGTGEAAYTAEGIVLPAYGVYVGEVRQPGLEDGATALPLRHHR